MPPSAFVPDVYVRHAVFSINLTQLRLGLTIPNNRRRRWMEGTDADRRRIVVVLPRLPSFQLLPSFLPSFLSSLLSGGLCHFSALRGPIKREREGRKERATGRLVGRSQSADGPFLCSHFRKPSLSNIHIQNRALKHYMYVFRIGQS